MHAQAIGLNLGFSRPSDRNIFNYGPNVAPATSSSAFTFTFHAAIPSVPLTFSRHAHATRPAEASRYHPLHSSAPHGSARLEKKRKLANKDDATDSAGGPIRKKRRLRLTLITSRLSRPFAVPTTHIADRGRSRIAAWAKQQKKALWGRALLRKAAILNSVTLRRSSSGNTSAEQRGHWSSPNMPARSGVEVEQEGEKEQQVEMMLLRQKGVEMARLARLRGSLATVNSTRPVDFPLPYAEQHQYQQQPTRVLGERATPNVATAAVAVTKTVVQRVVESPNFRHNCYAPSPPSPLRQSNCDDYGSGTKDEDGEEDGQDDVRCRSDDAVEMTKEQEEEREVEADNDLAYFESLIFGITATAVTAAADCPPALVNNSVFVSEYDRLDDLNGGGDDGAFASSILSSSSASASTSTPSSATTAVTTNESDEAVSLLSPAVTDEQLEPTNVVKRPPRPKGWNPNFASALPPPSPLPSVPS